MVRRVGSVNCNVVPFWMKVMPAAPPAVGVSVKLALRTVVLCKTEAGHKAAHSRGNKTRVHTRISQSNQTQPADVTSHPKAGTACNMPSSRLVVLFNDSLGLGSTNLPPIRSFVQNTLHYDDKIKENDNAKLC